MKIRNIYEISTHLNSISKYVFTSKYVKIFKVKKFYSIQNAIKYAYFHAELINLHPTKLCIDNKNPHPSHN